MFKNRNFLKIRIIIILAAVNILLVFLISFLIYNNTTINRNYNKILAQADAAISRSAYESAETLILKILPFTRSDKNSLRIIKRAFRISEASGNYIFFNKIAAAEYNKKSTNTNIVYAYLYSLNKTDQYKKTIDTAAKIKNYHYLKDIISEAAAAVYLKTFNDELFNKIYITELSKIISGTKTAQIYEEIFSQYANTKLLNNLLLLKMNEMNYKQAEELIMLYSSEIIINKELSALIYFDNQNYKKAYDTLKHYIDNNVVDDPGILLIYADILMNLKNYSSAGDIYSFLIDHYHDYSFIPYLNLEWINYTEHNIFKSDLFETSINLFPEKIDIINAFFIEAAAGGIDFSNSASLYSDIFKNKNINQNRYVSELWEVFNLGLFTAPLNIYFAGELFRLGKYNDLSVFLDNETIKESSLANFYKALLSVNAEKNIEKAISYFNKYYNDTNKWEALYNIALLNIKINNFDSAQLFLNKTLLSVNDKKLISDIYTWKAYCSLKVKDYASAGISLQNALFQGSNSLFYKSLENYYEAKRVEVR